MKNGSHVLFYSCPYCEERFPSWNTTKQHLKTYHPLEEPIISEHYVPSAGDDELITKGE